MTPIEKIALGLGVTAILTAGMVVTAGILREIWRERRKVEAEPAVPSHYVGIPIATHPLIDDDRIYLIGAEGKPVGVITGLTPEDCLPPFAGGDDFPQHVTAMPYDWWADRYPGLRGGPRV